jgi:hypothetical protein
MSTKIGVFAQGYDPQPIYRVCRTEFGEVVEEIARFWKKDLAEEYASMLRVGYKLRERRLRRLKPERSYNEEHDPVLRKAGK